jgi:hypothetical protein
MWEFPTEFKPLQMMWEVPAGLTVAVSDVGSPNRTAGNVGVLDYIEAPV